MKLALLENEIECIKVIKLSKKESLFVQILYIFLYIIIMYSKYQKIDEFAQNIRKKHREAIRKKQRENFNYETFPLQSQLLQQYHQVPHRDLYQYIHSIQHLLTTHNLQLLTEQQHDLLIDDLFYLTHQFPDFAVHRGIKFLKNQSLLTASYVALVSSDIMPQELAYWLPFICEQDKQIVYLSIITQNNHYISWIKHQGLRNELLIDLKLMKSAASAVKQIVGYRRYPPEKIVTSKGESLDSILIDKFTTDLQGMEKTFMCSEHLQIALWVITAKWKQECTRDLQDLLNKIVIQRIELVQEIFIIWVLQFMKEGFKILNRLSTAAILKKIESNSFKTITNTHYQELLHFLTEIAQ